MWTPLREEIGIAQKYLHIPESEFRPLPHTTNWHELEEKIYKTFCQLEHPTDRPIWLWTIFKNKEYFLDFETTSYLFLTSLVDKEETVWFMVNETVNENEKFWFYEGKVEAIQTVFGESTYTDEIYLISKKYEWILCLNHHDCFIGSGKKIIENMQQLAVSLGRPV